LASTAARSGYAARESFFSERTACKVFRSRDQAKAGVFDYIERFRNPKRHHSTIEI
jgi:putative transposase